MIELDELSEFHIIVKVTTDNPNCVLEMHVSRNYGAETWGVFLDPYQDRRLGGRHRYQSMAVRSALNRAKKFERDYSLEAITARFKARVKKRSEPH